MRIGGGTLVSMGTASSGGTLSASTVTPTTLCSVLGIDEVSTETGMLHVFPNPCSDLLTVELNEAITHFQTIYQVSIYDISGRLIKTFRMRNELPGYSIDVSGFPSGVYYVSVNSPNGIQVKKFIKI